MSANRPGFSLRAPQILDELSSAFAREADTCCHKYVADSPLLASDASGLFVATSRCRIAALHMVTRFSPLLSV